MSKAGRVLILAVLAAATVPSATAAALIGAVPPAVATLLFLWLGRETRQWTLEEPTVPRRPPPQPQASGS